MAQVVNPNADVIGKNQAMGVNCSAAKGLQSLLKTNLGPSGTMKMYVFFHI
jgi:T-complex protein 1 subunit zeta